MYFDLGNQSQVYELTLKLEEIRQGEDIVTKYFNSLKRLWHDLDLYNDYEWESLNDCNHYKKTVEDNRIFKFDIGLNVEFDEVRGRIIRRQPLPSVGEVFLEVRREKSSRLVMPGKMNLNNTVENSGVTGINASRNTAKKPDEMSCIWCDHCNRPLHTREICWKIHGKPANWKGSHEGRFSRTPAAHGAEYVPFNKGQMDQLLKLLKSNSGLFTTPNAYVAQASSISKALSCHFPVYSTPWIIDSGASDHMTSFSHLFHSCNPCSGHEKNCIVDGSYSTIVGKGLINLSKNISLKNVIHVLKLVIYYWLVNYLKTLNMTVSFRNITRGR